MAVPELVPHGARGSLAKPEPMTPSSMPIPMLLTPLLLLVPVPVQELRASSFSESSVLSVLTADAGLLLWLKVKLR